MYSISPVYALFVMRELLHRGLAAGDLFAGTSLNRQILETGADIRLDDFTTLLANARQQAADDTLGLMLGRKINVVALGQIGGAIATAPTVREGLQILENFSRLHASHVKVELVSNLRGMSVRFLYLQSLGETGRFHSETAVSLVQNYVEMVTDQPLDDAEILFRFADPGYPQEYRRSLHSPTFFGREHTSIEVPRHWLDIHSPYFNSEIWNDSQRLLAQRIREIGDDEDSAYSQHMMALLRSFEPPLPDLNVLVKRLHISARTLNRRLQEEGTSFRQIKNRVLHTWARQYLTETRQTVESIAVLLGYGDTANFRRAFRNQEGCSPNEFRHRVTVG